ncbi:MAG: DegQ family serine endoprotease [Gammaproteobacteria bacterium]|jgi:serine protease Do
MIKHSRNFLVLTSVLLFLSTQLLIAQSLPDFTPLIEKNSPAVVNISTTQKTEKQQQFVMPDMPENSPFYEFFEKYFNQNPQQRPPSAEQSSLGSGFIITEDGYIITNNHVVSDADEIIVKLNDRREFVAEVIGTDPRSDIAVIKIDSENLPVLKLGDSSDLKVGEWVLAIGSPFGFDKSVTQGIVSAMGRSLPNDSYVPFIQTDVAINPGNSGGPLFNLNGEVIGVNSQIYSRNGGYMGLSFAVPINVVTDVYEQIINKGSVSRGWLGVIIQDVTRELAESFGMDIPGGALVARVLPDTPAERSDLEIGDVIIKFNNYDVDRQKDLPPIVGTTKVGAKVPVEVIRAGKKKTLMVTIEELPENLTTAQNETENNLNKVEKNPLNVVVEVPSQEEREQYQIEDYGVVVKSLEEGPASLAGIREGDVILLLDNEKVTNIEVFDRLIKKIPRNKSIPVLIQRRGNPTFLALKLEDE